MSASPNSRSGRLLILALMLGGGTLFGTCQMRLRDAIVDSSKQVFISLFDPSQLAALFDDNAGGFSEENP